MFLPSNGYIYFSLYCDDGRARASTGIAIKRGQGVIKGDLRKSEQLTLGRIEDAVTKYIEGNRRMEQPILKSEVVAVVRKAMGKDVRMTAGTFEQDYKKMMDDMSSGKLLNPKNKLRYSEGTITNYNSTLTYIKRFSTSTGLPLTYNIDDEWVRRLVVWLTDADYSKNTIATVVSNLKGFFGYTYKKKHNNLIHKTDALKISREDGDAEALTVDEIKTLYNMKLRGAQDRARDVFVFACWVGLRSSDLQRINQYRLQGNFFDLLTQKTGERVVIPVHPMARAIYEKYNGQMPIFKHNNLLNGHIKNICRDAGINELCLMTMTKGGRRIGEQVEKWEVISIHSARRSFATNAVKAGLENRQVMLITGHTTEQSFKRYVKITKKENAERMAEHPFFKGE